MITSPPMLHSGFHVVILPANISSVDSSFLSRELSKDFGVG